MSYNRKYTYATKDGKRCRLNEKQVGLLVSRLYQAVLSGKVEITTFPDYPLVDSPMMTVLTRGRDNDGQPCIVRYYGYCGDDGGFVRTTPIICPQSLFYYQVVDDDTTNAFSSFDVLVARAKDGATLKSFHLSRGA